MKVRWIATEQEGGNFYGFGKHSQRAREGLAELGVEIDPAAPVAVHVSTPLLFHPCADARNVLLTHWEFEHVPTDVAAKLDQADLVVAASTWTADVLRRHTSTPVLSIPLGVDRCFSPHRRKIPGKGEPFVFLFVGAPNLRKGIDLVAHKRGVWSLFGWDLRPDALLYVKTSSADSAGTVEAEGNVIVDSRRLPVEELVGLYRRANVFLFPTRGEGFGLPLAEAMASGCPALYTDVGGVRDFAGDPVPSMPGTFVSRDGFSERTEVATMVPNPHALDHRMNATMRDYRNERDAAYERGRRIFRAFTWDRYAERLFGALAGLEGVRGAA